MLDAIPKDIGFTFTLGFGVLLGAQDKGFGTVLTIDLIQHFVETFQLLVALCVVVDEVGLDARVGTDAHDDDASSLVMVALTEDAFHAAGGGLHNLLGGIGGGKQSLLAHIPILWEVFTEAVGIDEDADGLGYGLLLAELLGTAGGEVGDAGAQGCQVSHHARERA